MKKIEMLFYKTNPSEKNTGLKFVLFEVTAPDNSIVHDWGFAYWNETHWDEIETPEGYAAKVAYWANTLNPDVLLGKPTKIIKI